MNSIIDYCSIAMFANASNLPHLLKISRNRGNALRTPICIACSHCKYHIERLRQEVNIFAHLECVYLLTVRTALGEKSEKLIHISGGSYTNQIRKANILMTLNISKFEPQVILTVLASYIRPKLLTKIPKSG